MVVVFEKIFVVLIGINNYCGQYNNVKNLYGCVKDVDIIDIFFIIIFCVLVGNVYIFMFFYGLILEILLIKINVFVLIEEVVGRVVVSGFGVFFFLYYFGYGMCIKIIYYKLENGGLKFVGVYDEGLCILGEFLMDVEFFNVLDGLNELGFMVFVFFDCCYLGGVDWDSLYLGFGGGYDVLDGYDVVGFESVSIWCFFFDLDLDDEIDFGNEVGCGDGDGCNVIVQESWLYCNWRYNLFVVCQLSEFVYEIGGRGIMIYYFDKILMVLKDFIILIIYDMFIIYFVFKFGICNNIFF